MALTPGTACVPPQEMARYLVRLVGWPEPMQKRMEIYEEIKSEPTVMVERLDERWVAAAVLSSVKLELVRVS